MPNDNFITSNDLKQRLFAILEGIIEGEHGIQAQQELLSAGEQITAKFAPAKATPEATPETAPSGLVDFRTYRPRADDPDYQRAATILKDLKTPRCELELKNDDFGAWIHIWDRDQDRGVAFIQGELYELDPNCFAWGDIDPYWSPVVQADYPELARVYKAISGKEYPVFMVDGSDPDAWAYYQTLKQEKGFSWRDEAENFVEDRLPGPEQFSESSGLDMGSLQVDEALGEAAKPREPTRTLSR